MRRKRFIKLEKSYQVKKLDTYLKFLLSNKDKSKLENIIIYKFPKKQRIKKELRKLDNEHPLKDNNLKEKLNNSKSKEIKFKPVYLWNDKKEKLRNYLKEFDKLEWLKEEIKREKVIIMNKEDFFKMFKRSIIEHDSDLIMSVKHKSNGEFVYITTKQVVLNSP